MIIFVDGIDGSGKTTLIHHLTAELTARDIPTHITPPLWRYLTTITKPDDFATWVITTDSLTVATTLLHAMSTRIEHLPHQTHTDTIHLVDRGPKTVYACARAHTADDTTVDPRLDTARADLAAVVNHLTAATACRAVELHTDHPPHTAIDRLRQLQQITPRYHVYLHALSRQLTTTPAWPGLPPLRLRAIDPVQVNTQHAIEAILTRPNDGSCRHISPP